MNDSDPTPSIPTIHSRNESERTDASENDQMLFKFLSWLEDDILSNPEKLIALDWTLLARLDSLAGGIEVDINSPLSADDEWSNALLQILTQMTEHWLHPIIPTSMPTSTLARADGLVRKTAFLAGLVAPETAASLSKLLRVTNAHYSSVIDGNPSEPESLERELVLEHFQSAFGDIPELRRRIVLVLCQHYQVLHKRTHRAAIGAFARALTFEHFALLGLHPHLWSLSRGLSRRLGEYQSATAMNDDMRTDGLEGAQQLIGGGLLAFIEFMLDVCLEEVGYMTAALNRCRLRESVTHAYRTNSRLKEAGISPETMPALLALLIQGSLPRTEFVTFTGLPREAASDQLDRLINLGIVVSPPSNIHRLEASLPIWLAQDILPGLQ